MSLVEGVGDELLYLAGFFVVFTFIFSRGLPYLGLQFFFEIVFGEGSNDESIVHRNSTEETNPDHSNESSSRENISKERENKQNVNQEETINLDLNENKKENSQNNDEKKEEEKEEEEEEEEGDLRLKLQYIDGKQRSIKANSLETIDQFKKKHFKKELNQNRRVRLILNGHELNNDSNNLSSHNIKSDSIIHCLILSQSSPNQPPPRYDDNSYIFSNRFYPAGSILYPIIGFILAFVWYFRMFYRGYFNGISTFSLVSLTFFFILISISFLRAHSQANHN